MAKRPWELHASATLPRFNYSAASSFSSLKGFLITCIFDREKSATKEAIGFLKEYLKSSPLTVDETVQSCSASELVDQWSIPEHIFSDDTNSKSEREGDTFCRPIPGDFHAGIAVEQTEKSSSENAKTNSSLHPDAPLMSSKRVEVIPPVEDRVETNGVDIQKEKESSTAAKKTDSPDVVREMPTVKECQSPKTGGTGTNSKKRYACLSDSSAEDRLCFFPLKMAQKGIISLFLEDGYSDDPVSILTEALADIENGVKEPPQWFHRIVPVQASCVLLRESLSAVVFKLVKQHLRDAAPTEDQPLKYAIGYNRHGIEAKDDMVGRMDCIHLVAETVAKVSSHMVADLRAPQMVVIIEVIPLAAIQGSPICGVAVLSGEAVNVKPKLCVKPISAASRRSKKSKT